MSVDILIHGHFFVGILYEPLCLLHTSEVFVIFNINITIERAFKNTALIYITWHWKFAKSVI